MTMSMVAAVAVVVNAQEFGNAATPAEGTSATAAVQALPPATGTGAAVAEMQQVQEEETVPAPTATAKEQIQAYFNSKEDWQSGYDEEKDRIIVIDAVEFDVKNPKVSSDFINLRKEKMSELMLMAKAKIIETIMSKMSGSRILEIPGNPIAKQLEKEQKEMNKALQVARENLAKLDADLSAALAARDDVTASELVAVISSWFTKAEKENIAAKFDVDKKELYANVKSDFEAAAAQYKELSEQAEALKGTVSKEMKTSLSRVANMPIYGCTVLQQADSIKEENGRFRCQIAIIYSWSGEMMKASGEILKGESVKFKPGKKSIKQWLAGKAKKGALAQWVGPRNYIDNKGNMWFLGISCAATDDDADTNMENREIAELEAGAEVMFSLYSDAMSSKTANELIRTKVGANGEKERKVYKDYNKTQGESFKDIQISGNAELYSGTVRHEASGLDIQVVVYGVNSGSVKTLKDIQARAAALGIEVNTYQEMERGRQERLRSTFEASKDNSAARAIGAAAASSDLKAKAAAPAAARKASPTKTFKALSSQPATKTRGTLRTGTQMIVDEDDED